MAHKENEAFDILKKSVHVRNKPLWPVDVRIGKKKTQGKILNSVSGVNYCIFGHVSWKKIDLCDYPAQFLMRWKGRVSKILNSHRFIGKACPYEGNRMTKCLDWGKGCCVSSHLLGTRESIWTVVGDPNQSFVWSLHEMQISVLVEVPPLKCFVITRVYVHVCFQELGFFL